MRKISKIRLSEKIGKTFLTRISRLGFRPFFAGSGCCEEMDKCIPEMEHPNHGAYEEILSRPEFSDLLIVAGPVNIKYAEKIKDIYELMPEPKWVIAFGACASSGGIYRSYPVYQGLDKIIPVDLYIAGCPPSDKDLVKAVKMLGNKRGKDVSPMKKNVKAPKDKI